MTNQSAITAKIQKLLALATSSNEHEAASAATKAHAMLAEHNLSMASVQATDDTSNDMGHNEHSNSDSSKEQWIIQLWSATAKLYFCGYFFCKNPYDQTISHTLVGSPANSAAAASMAKFLTDTVQALSKRNSGPDLFCSDPSTKPRSVLWLRTFRTGASETICTRLRDRLKELKAGQQSQNDIANANNLPALYKSTEQEVAAYTAQNFNLKSSRPSKARLDPGAYKAGRSAGTHIGLETQVGASAGSSTLALS